MYGYDAAGNRITLTTLVSGVSNTATYTFDVLNRMSSVTDADGNITSYSFDANSNQTRIDQANGTATTMAFDALNRVTTITHLGPANQTLASLSYTLDDTGRRTAITESNGRSSAYTYDELYRLTGESIIDPQVGNHNASFEYNAVSNRISDTVNGITTGYTFDDNDRLTANGLNTYTYDDNGNTVSEVVDGQSNSYSYDSQNRLIQASMGGVVQAMSYDPDGIRIEKNVGGVTTDFLTDTNRAYAQVLHESTPTTALQYTFGLDLVGMNTGTENFTYHSDALGSTRLLTNNAGQVADDVRYDAWGEQLAGGDVAENQYLYTGEQFDSQLDKIYLRARYYAPGVGRFGRMDDFHGWADLPISLNKYIYAGVDPVRYADPTGLAFSLHSVMSAIRAQSTAMLSTYAGQFGGQFVGRKLVWNGACFMVEELTEKALETAVDHFVGIYIFDDINVNKPYIVQSTVSIEGRVKTHFDVPRARIQSLNHILPVSIKGVVDESIDEIVTSLEQMFIDDMGTPSNTKNPNGTLANKRHERDLSKPKNKKYKDLIDKFELCKKIPG